MKKTLFLLIMVYALIGSSQPINYYKNVEPNVHENGSGLVNCIRFFPNYGVVICGSFDYGYVHLPPYTPITISENIVAIDSNGDFSALGSGVHRPGNIQNLYYVDTIQGDLIVAGDIPGCLFRFNKNTSTWINYNLIADSTVRVCLGVSNSKVLLVGDFKHINNVSCHFAALYDIDSNTVTPVNLFPGVNSWIAVNRPWRDKGKIYFPYLDEANIPIFNTTTLNVAATNIPNPGFFYVRYIVAHDSIIYIAGLDNTVTSRILKYANGSWSTFCNVQNNDCALTYDAVNKELYASGGFTNSCGYPCNQIFKYNENSSQYSCVDNVVPNGFLGGMVITSNNQFFGLMGTGAICTSSHIAINSIAVPPEKNEYSVYPNPATNQLNINLGGLQAEQVCIYNTNGQLLSMVKQPTGNRLDISTLATGIYIAEVKVKDIVQRVRWVKM